jgi:hypothetical protein
VSTIPYSMDYGWSKCFFRAWVGRVRQGSDIGLGPRLGNIYIDEMLADCLLGEWFLLEFFIGAAAGWEQDHGYQEA